jgi:hypothetical protein
MAIVIMVLFRVWEIHAGRIVVREEYIPETFFSIDRMEASVDEFFGKMKIYSLRAVVFGISHAIVFLRHARKTALREWSTIAPRLSKHLKNFPHFSNLPHHSAGSSFFLKDISAHKEEVRRENGYHEK